MWEEDPRWQQMHYKVVIYRAQALKG